MTAYPFAQKPAICEFDINLAVRAEVFILGNRTTSMIDCTELVYGPTDKLIKNLADIQPKTVTVFCGRIYRPEFPKSENGQCVNVYIVDHQNRVAYLCTVLNMPFAVAMHELLCRQALEKSELELYLFLLEKNLTTAKALEIVTGKLAKLITEGVYKIRRRRIRISVPVSKIDLDSQAIEKGIKKYFTVKFPFLANAEISWMDQETRASLLQVIYKRAHEMKENLPPQTKSDRMNIRILDSEF